MRPNQVQRVCWTSWPSLLRLGKKNKEKGREAKAGQDLQRSEEEVDRPVKNGEDGRKALEIEITKEGETTEMIERTGEEETIETNGEMTGIEEAIEIEEGEIDQGPEKETEITEEEDTTEETDTEGEVEVPKVENY